MGSRGQGFGNAQFYQVFLIYCEVTILSFPNEIVYKCLDIYE